MVIYNFTTDIRPSTEQLVQEYCGLINTRIAGFIILGAVFWLLEPVYKKLVVKFCENKFRGNDDLYFSVRDFAFMLYKLLGVGILVLQAILIFFI